MDLEAAVQRKGPKYAKGTATEHSETIIDASGPATEHSEEGRPRRIPIIEVAFSKGMWWSIPQEMSAQLFAKFEAGQDAGYTWDWGNSRKGSFVVCWSPNKGGTTEGGFLLALYRITFADQDFLSWPTCLDLPSPAANSLWTRICCRGLLA